MNEEDTHTESARKLFADLIGMSPPASTPADGNRTAQEEHTQPTEAYVFLGDLDHYGQAV